MRYFTKQWYNEGLVAEMCFQLRKTEKAGELSERFFEKLYEIEKRAYLKHSKRVSKFEKRRFDPVAAAEEFDSNQSDFHFVIT